LSSGGTKVVTSGWVVVDGGSQSPTQLQSSQLKVQSGLLIPQSAIGASGWSQHCWKLHAQLPAQQGHDVSDACAVTVQAGGASQDPVAFGLSALLSV